jgi:hypothetical protein
MLPIVAAVPAPLAFTLGVSLVVPALGVVALCCAALAYAGVQRASGGARRTRCTEAVVHDAAVHRLDCGVLSVRA